MTKFAPELVVEQPGGRSPAPDELALVQAFVNTLDVEGGTDSLSEPTALRDWLSRARLLEDEPSVLEGDVQRAIGVREALRSLLMSNNGAPASAAAHALLNRAAEAALLTVRFDERTPRPRLVASAPGVDGALGMLLTIVVVAAQDGTWTRLKACKRDACRWAFYDRSKGGSGTWCSMSVCGNRAKVGDYRRRRRARR